jgi:hypothetical protein
MQKGHLLQFCCHSCQHPVQFSVFDIEKGEEIRCSECGLMYDFSDEILTRKLRKFENLCRQIQLSEEILSNTSVVGVYLGDREFKIPYKLLLTRLNSTLDLMVGDRPLTITFRIEPALDYPIEMVTRTLKKG